ncbi:hypothetical protein CCHR01_19591 [Colletotrichum chrysophilum]|uniref:Uncharacterized protein n=1 Tax=Colletotrichum chrysophilum TaxID=1836956 RepID=A0AAD8ZYQ2_9PEZI|nr:hypothetical protein CCHR01_19591 [Colletotrichum chrysophilum]
MFVAHNLWSRENDRETITHRSFSSSSMSRSRSRSNKAAQRSPEPGAAAIIVKFRPYQLPPSQLGPSPRRWVPF